MEQFREVKLPLLTEAGELQQEANCVVGLVQTGQALHCSYCIQALRGRGQGNMAVSDNIL